MVKHRLDPFIKMDDNGDLTFSPERDWSFGKNIISKAETGHIPYVEEYTHSGEGTQGEKVLLSRYLMAYKPLLLDLEVGFTRKRSPEEILKSKTGRLFVADRIDFAQIDFSDFSAPKLKLIEAKRATDSRLASIPENEPEVLTQITYYQDFIDTAHAEILKSYKQVARNMLELGIIKNRTASSGDSVSAIFETFADHGRLDQKPYLLILGSQADFDNPTTSKHLDRLDSLLTAKNQYQPIRKRV